MPYENFTVHTPVHVRARAHTHTHARTHTHTHTPTPTHARARARAHTHTHIYFVFLTYPYNTLIFSKQIIQISKSIYSRMNAVRVLSHLIQSVLLNDIWGYDKTLNFRCALIYLSYACVPVVAFGGHFSDITHTAQNLDTLVSWKCSRFGGSQFCHRSFLKMTNTDWILKHLKTFSFTFPEIQILEKYIQWNLILAFLLNMLAKRILQRNIFFLKCVNYLKKTHTHTHTHNKMVLLYTTTCFGCPDQPSSGRCLIQKKNVKGERPLFTVVWIINILF